MATLSTEQVKQRLEKPLNSDAIVRSRRLEERLKLHVEEVEDQSVLHSRFKHFLDWVQDILPPDKVVGFKTLWQAPVETNELTDTIFSELSRVLHAENPYKRHKFRDSESEIEHLEFLERVNDSRFWEVDYWKEIQADQNSFVVVDLPAVQTTPRPEPYKYLLDNECLIDADVNSQGRVEYLIFWCEGGLIACIDDMSWRKFEVPFDDKGMPDLTKAVEIANVPHTLKRVPAAPVYFDPINKHSNLVNKNPISKSLGALDWLLFFQVAKKFLETYAPFPIYATYSELQDDKAETKRNGEESFENGIEHVLTDGVTFRPNVDHKNRNEANRKLTGPGTIQRYDPPMDSNDSDLLSNPVQVIPAEEVSLNYCESQVQKRKDEILKNCVGIGGDVVSMQAVNEDQVQGTFESKVNVLKRIREKIEVCMKYINAVEAELRYGAFYISSDISLGDRHYLTSVKEQQDELTASRNAGLSQFEIDNQINAIYKNKYRDQPEVLSRNEILAQIEPYPGLTIQQVTDLLSKGLAIKEKALIKIDFMSLIKRFEREQMNVVQFASARPMQTKVEIIFNKLLEYVKSEQQQFATTDGSSEQVEGAPGASGSSGGSLPPQN
jgi:hypothetical protein